MGKRILSPLIVAALLVAQQGPCIEALANTVQAPVPAAKTGVTLVGAVPVQPLGGPGSLAGASAPFSPSFTTLPAAASPKVGLTPLVNPGMGGAAQAAQPLGQVGLPASVLPAASAPLGRVSGSAVSPVLSRSEADAAAAPTALPAARAAAVRGLAAGGVVDADKEAYKGKAADHGSLAALSGLRAELGASHLSPAAAEAALGRAFNGGPAKTESAAPGQSADTIGALPSSRVRVYLKRHGHETVETSLTELPGILAASGFSEDFNLQKAGILSRSLSLLGKALRRPFPRLAESIAKRAESMAKRALPMGHFRLILGEGNTNGDTLSTEDSAALQEYLRASGLNVVDQRVRSEGIPGVRWDQAGSADETPSASTPGEAGVQAPAQTGGLRRWFSLRSLTRAGVAAATAGAYVTFFGLGAPLAVFMLMGLVSNADRIVKELSYAFGMLRVAFKDSKRPQWNEILGGILGKVVPAVINIGVFVTMYQGHPYALVFATLLSLAVEIFHGIWVNAWDTFQSKIGRHRGPLYQNIFNFFYGQVISGSFRIIAFVALANVAPPWFLEYWKDMILMTVLGTFFGTLGYRGLNSLYEKGRISRSGRASTQQARDFFMMIVGPFFSTGNMFVTWLLFGFMQALDLTIYAIDRRARTRPLVYVADERVAQSETFQSIYVKESSSLKAAWDGIKGFILFKAVLTAYDWLRRKMRRADRPSETPGAVGASGGTSPRQGPRV